MNVVNGTINDKVESTLAKYLEFRIFELFKNRMIDIIKPHCREDSVEDLLPFLKQYVDKGVRNVLCTEISKDGTLAGPATDLYKQIMNEYPHLHLIASGGISCNEDIEELNSYNIPAVVFGKAFYEGKIDINKLLK